MAISDHTAILKRSVQAHREGDLVAAEAGYRDVLAAQPGNPDATHYLGMVAYQRGKLDRAMRLLGEAARARPDDPAILANLGLLLRALGQTAHAERVLTRSLELKPEQAEAWLSLAQIRSAAGRMEEAMICYRKVLEFSPASGRARLGLGRQLAAKRRFDEAATILEEGLTLDPSNPELQLELAQSRELAGDQDGAAALYQRVAETAPDLRARALALLSTSQRRRGRPGAALMSARSATWADHHCPEAWRALGQVFKESGRLRDAAEAFRKAHGIVRTPGSGFGESRLNLSRTTKTKLRHDIEQMKYLLRKEVPTAIELQPLISSYEAVLATIPARIHDAQPIEIPAQATDTIRRYYNRCVHYRHTPRLLGSALNPGLDTKAITNDYRERAPGLTWIDNFLGRDALRELRSFCLESTIWYDFEHSGGYLGAYLQEGFNCPLLLQIAEELPRKLPQIFGDHLLMQMWAYKYDSRMSGIDMHADFAAVNVNFWITPDEALLDSERGGMVVWDKEAPPEWGADEYNTYDAKQQKRIKQYLEQQNAQRVVVPYRSNRCVVFNSDLFHKTDDIRFRDNYEDRRINITMLFGTRDADRRGCRQ
jgi:tetratricopeptide (TPR) repeat protein